MRVFCALHRHLGLITALRRYPELRGEPVIVGGAPELRLPVTAASKPAAARGVRAGMPLRQAQQLCPEAAFVALDAEAVTELRGAVSEALHRLSPVVEAGDDEVFCDVSGTHVRYPNEAAWAAAVARALEAVLDDDPPCAGIAGSRFVARMAARCSGPSRIRRVPPGEEAAFLAPQPIGMLPVEPAIAARLAAFGLDCLGAVAAISPADLQRQFGREGLRMAGLARGEDGEPLQAELASRTLCERLVLEGPVGELEPIARSARHCALALGRQLREQAMAAGVVSLTLEEDEQNPVSLTVTAPVPVEDEHSAWTVVLGLLNELQPAGPVTAVSVEMTSLAPAGGRQTDLWKAGDAARDAVLKAARRLQARFGAGSVRRSRLATDPGDLPERRFVWEAPALAGAGRR